VITQTRYGLLFLFLFGGIVALIVLTYYRESTEPETRVSGYLEGRTYSNNTDGSIRLWEIRDTLIDGYPYEQVFVPTIVRVVENQAQGKL
jgi:hypothetical protein